MPISQFIQVKNPPPQNGCQFKFLFFICLFSKKTLVSHIHFPNSTGLSTKPTGRHYTKYQFSPDITAEPYIGCPYPCPCPPIPIYGFWVSMGAMLLFMGGHGCDIIVHGWASVLCIPAFNSKSESNFSDSWNTLTKKRSGLKPTTMNDLLFVRSNQDLV
jgi:hypothetical protein